MFCQWLFLPRLWWAGPGRKGYEVTSNHVTCCKTQSPALKTIASGKRDNKRSSSEIDADTSDSCLPQFLRGSRFWMEPKDPTILERALPAPRPATGWPATRLHEHPSPELPQAERTLESRWAVQSCHKEEGHAGMSRELSRALPDHSWFPVNS